MALHRVTVLVETDDPEWLESLQDGIESLICPHPADSDHRCPVPWFIIGSEVPEDEVADYGDLLNR